MNPKMMPPSIPMSTPAAPGLGSTGGTSGPVAPVAPSAVKSAPPDAKFNPDNKLPASAFHKPGR
jgi:hypothetical protein